MQWPFEGREEELSLIRDEFLAERHHALLVTGAAGVGKTRLVREALSTLDNTCWVGATRAAASVPFGALAPLFHDDAPAHGPVELIRSTLRDLQARGGRQSVVIAVDDAHLLDDASSTLIANLVTGGVAFVVMTARTGEPVPDVLLRLCKESQALGVELTPLPDPVINRLIEHGASADLDPRRRRWLRRHAQGNPLALRELLHGSVPGGLSDLILSRLDELDLGTRKVVELIACGEPLSVSIVERLSDIASLTRAEQAGLIAVQRHGERRQARLDHPLYGEVLRARLPRTRVMQLHRELARALLDTPLRRREDRMLAAVWQVEGGAVTRPDVVREGAWLAVGHADLELAERLARVARTSEPGPEADRLLAEILAYRGRQAEARQVLSERPPDSECDLVAWAVTRAETLYWGGGDLPAALSILDSMGGAPDAEGSRSWLLFFDGRCADSARIASHVLNSEQSAKAVVWASAAGTAANGFLGRMDEARRIHLRGCETAKEHGESLPWARFEVDVGLCLAHLADGNPFAAKSIADTGYRDALEGGAIMMVVGWALYGGIAAAARGHLTDAQRLLREAVAGFEVNDTFRLMRPGLAALASVSALVGQPAFSLMSRADALEHPSNRLFASWIESWRAWIACTGGDLPAASQCVARAADEARRVGAPAVEALALYDMARMGMQPDLKRLDNLDHELAQLLAGTARAMAARDGARLLEETGGLLHERGYDLHAAEVFAAAARQHRLHRRDAQADLASARVARLREDEAGTGTPLLQLSQVSSPLSPRETQVLLMAARYTSTQIADRLRLAVPTVNNNLARAYAKLGITGRAQLRALLGRETR